MLQANVDLVRRGLESPDSFWALLDEHVVFDTRSFTGIDVYGTPVVVGRKAVMETSRRWWGTWDDYDPDAEELIDVGSSVVGVVRERARGRGSGVPLDRRRAQSWTFRRGRIIRWELFPDRVGAVEIVGLSE